MQCQRSVPGRLHVALPPFYEEAGEFSSKRPPLFDEEK